MKKIIIAVLLFTIAIPIPSAFAWGQEGHRIIGQIAYNHLNKKAKKKVNQILGEKGLIFWANWADEIKSDTIYPDSYDWHFQDLNAGMTEAELLSTLTNYPTEGGNLWRVMDSLTAKLAQNPTDFDALRFLIHLAGDRFCPMHTAHLDDLGGNKIKLQWFGQNSNLHRVWDTDLIAARGYSYSEYAEYLELHFSYEQKKIEKMSAETWLIHNYNLCNEIYSYHETWDGNTYHYIYHFAPLMEWQLYAAGIRLAQLLNEIYG